MSIKRNLHLPGEPEDNNTDRTGKNPFNILNRRTFSSFKNRIYLLYFGALLGQMAAMNMQMLARSLLVYRLTGSGTILGIISVAHAIPMLIFSLFGGIIADRFQKKYVMLAGQSCSALIALAVGLSLHFGYLSADIEGSWWILIVASILQGTIMGLMMPSRQSMLPEIVGEQQLMNAVSLNTLGTNTLRIIAPAVTGFLIDAFDFEAVYFSMAGMYLIAVVFILFLPLSSKIRVHTAKAITDIKDGVQYIRKDRTILLLLLFTLMAVVLSMPYILLMPIFTEDILDVGATGMGVLLSVSGIGAIAGSLFLASSPNKRRGLLLLISSLIMGIALTGFAFSTNWYLSLVIIVFVGLGQTGRMTLGNTLIQYYVQNEYRGRVMSFYMMNFGLTSFGTFFAGVLADRLGAPWALGIFAITLIAMTLLAIVFLPRIRKLD